MAMSLETAQKTAAAVFKRLAPYCKRIEVAGSIRRRRPQVNDIDIVLIPSDPWQLHQEVLKLGQTKMAGSKSIRVDIGVTQIDLYVADPATWATLLLIRTGSKDNNIRLASRAKERGWRLAASGDGLFNEKGERIAGDTERSIYEALGLPYKEPWERN